MHPVHSQFDDQAVELEPPHGQLGAQPSLNAPSVNLGLIISKNPYYLIFFLRPPPPPALNPQQRILDLRLFIMLNSS